MTPTPDPTLAARLAELKRLSDDEPRGSDYALVQFDSACGSSFDAGQLITLADHLAAVQAAVADARLEMINSLKDEIARQEGEGGEGSSLWCVIDGERTIHEIHAQERMDARVQAAVAKAVEAERARNNRSHSAATLFWVRASQKALAGDPRELQNRVDLCTAAPAEVVLSAASIRARKGDAL